MPNTITRATSITLSALMTVNLCSAGLPAIAYAEETTVVSGEVAPLSSITTPSRFILRSGSYSTRLRLDYSKNPLLEVSFVERKDGEVVMTNQDAHDFLTKGKIQFNDGKIYTFEEAGFKLAHYGREESNSSFQSANAELIRSIVESGSFKVAIQDPEGNLVLDDKGALPEDHPIQFTEEEVRDFVKKYDAVAGQSVDKSALEQAIAQAEAAKETDFTPESYVAVREALKLAKTTQQDYAANQDAVTQAQTKLSDALAKLQRKTGDQQEIVITAAGFDKEHSKWDEKWGITFNKPASEFNDEVQAGTVASIEVNGVSFTGKDEIIRNFSTTLTAEHLYVANSYADAITAFKKTDKEASAKIRITYTNGKTVSFGLDATETPDDQASGAGVFVPGSETTDTTGAETPVESKDSFNRVKVELVKFDNNNEPSMSGATMIPEAQLLRSEDGSGLLVLHFKPAVINGISAYATGLTLANQTSNEFILAEDNSATCILGIPAFEGQGTVIDGHIYSSVMDAPVSLRISQMVTTSDIAKALDDKVKESKNILATGKFYEKTRQALQAAIDEASAHPKNPSRAYAKLVSAQTKLREELEDPFVGDTLFFVDAVDSSVVGVKLLAPQVRVDVDNQGNKKITGVYNSSHQWWAQSSITNVKVYSDDARQQEIPVTIKDLGEGRLQFSFVVKDMPASGVFKTQIEEEGGIAPITSDLQLDYSSLRKGPQKPLLTEAIRKADSYLADDFSTVKPLSEKENDFTPASWAAYREVIDDCLDDLKTDMSQDLIDIDIARVREARKKLIYKVMAGTGNTVTAGTHAFNNPNNYYISRDEFDNKPNQVGWAGSKIIFGKDAKTYRVLDTGKKLTDGVLQNTGKILIMAEDDRVKKQFAPQEPTGIQDAVRWDTSGMRSYLNTEFLNTHFTSAQKQAIVESEIVTSFSHNPYDTSRVPDITTKDKIFAPSVEMLKDPAYGYGSNDARSTTASYGLRNLSQDMLGRWALMSVKPKGTVDSYFKPASLDYETLPAMNLDASRILMTVDAERGFESGLQPVSQLETNTWKLVLKRDDLKVSNVQAKREGNTVSFTATSTTPSYAALVVEGKDVNSGKLIAAGIVDPQGFTLPNDFNPDTQKLYVMGISEANSGYEASDAVQIPANQLVASTSTAGQTSPQTSEKQKPAASNTVEVSMYKNGKSTKSMADDMFAAKADIIPQGDSVILKLYVAYPIPAFANLGADGTILRPSIEYKGMNYKGVIDVTSKPTMTVKRKNAGFGLVKGAQIPAEVISFKLPKEALKEEFLKVHAYVNVVMDSDVTFDMYLKNLDIDLNTPSSGGASAGSDASATTNTSSGSEPSFPEPTRAQGRAQLGASPVSSTTEEKPALNFRFLSNGTYSIIGDMYKADQSGESMANKALDHNVKLDVEDGTYYATLSFRGIKVGAKMGYLGTIEYADDSGVFHPAQVLESITVDGVNYPSVVRIPLSDSAVSSGWQKLRVFVQAMEDIAAGSGTQEVYLRLSADSVKEGYSSQDSFYGTIAETQGQRLPRTEDSRTVLAVLAGLGIAAAAVVFTNTRRRYKRY